MDKEVIKRFTQLSGMTPAEAATWRELCDDAEEELACRLKKEEDRTSGLFYAACAALAFYRYSLAFGGEESFSAGEVKITRQGSERNAAALWEQAEKAACRLFRDDSFVFRRVTS